MSHAVQSGRSGREGTDPWACSGGSAHGGGLDALTSENVDAMRDLKPWEKEAGKVEYMCVWKASVYVERSVVPSLRGHELEGAESWTSGTTYSGIGDQALYHSTSLNSILPMDSAEPVSCFVIKSTMDVREEGLLTSYSAMNFWMSISTRYCFCRMFSTAAGHEI